MLLVHPQNVLKHVLGPRRTHKWNLSSYHVHCYNVRPLAGNLFSFKASWLELVMRSEGVLVNGQPAKCIVRSERTSCQPHIWKWLANNCQLQTVSKLRIYTSWRDGLLKERHECHISLFLLHLYQRYPWTWYIMIRRWEVYGAWNGISKMLVYPW